MLIKVCAFTKKGRVLADDLFSKNEEWYPIFWEKGESLSGWTGEAFRMRLPLLFIGASGIAVRTIAPFVSDKLTDSPVIVMDEAGQFVIPILSGHVGGANALARRIAKQSGAVPVITTATDVESKFSVDVFAVEEGLFIKNREGIRHVSRKVLEGERLIVSVEEPYRELLHKIPADIEVDTYPPVKKADLMITTETIREEWLERDALCLIPKRKVLGIGCRKGKSFDELKEFVENELGVEFYKDVYAVASVDLKKDETGLMAFAQFCNVPFLTYSSEELAEVQGEFTESEFVQHVTGVSNVCERAALKVVGEKGKIIRKKIAYNGITLAVAEINR